MKDSISSLELRIVTEYLYNRLLGGWLDNIYGLVEEGYLFRFRTAERDRVDVVIEPGYTMYPTEYEVRKERELPSFARAARRYIRGSRVEGVEQVGFERLVVFSFRRREQRYRLMCELLPRGSLVLVNEENRILACSEAKRFRDRVIAPGRIYSPPAAVTLDPLSVSKEALTELLTT
ncbi:NFACT family protein, partial [archaeon]|nr:NFACT family protein [archaeon]